MSDDYLPTATGDAHPWGWFEDPDHNQSVGLDIDDNEEETRRGTKEVVGAVPKKALSLPPPVTEPPIYVLESNIETQELWYMTAGTRPRQPSDERRKCEEMWQRNFQRSHVNYNNTMSAADSNPNFREVEARNEFPEEVVSRGRGPFSNAVSKSFPNHAFACMTLQLPRFKVVRSQDGVCHAEFLIVVSTGGAPFGIWRRHSDFKNLAAKIQSTHTSSGEQADYKNTMLSWQCVLSRQRWFRCLDREYLSLKCFLLERFLHDLLFESSTPDIINEFLGLA